MSAGRPSGDARRRAREAALQMLYQWEVGGLDLDEVWPAYRLVRTTPLDADEQAHAQRLVRGTATSLDRIDPLLAAHSAHWRLERMPVLDRLVLRLATWELLDMPETPPGVVINEALELARAYSSEEAVKFINGVLDAISKQIAADRRR